METRGAKRRKLAAIAAAPTPAKRVLTNVSLTSCVLSFINPADIVRLHLHTVNKAWKKASAKPRVWNTNIEINHEEGQNSCHYKLLCMIDAMQTKHPAVVPSLTFKNLDQDKDSLAHFFYYIHNFRRTYDMKAFTWTERPPVRWSNIRFVNCEMSMETTWWQATQLYDHFRSVLNDIQDQGQLDFTASSGLEDTRKMREQWPLLYRNKKFVDSNGCTFGNCPDCKREARFAKCATCKENTPYTRCPASRPRELSPDGEPFPKKYCFEGRFLRFCSECNQNFCSDCSSWACPRAGCTNITFVCKDCIRKNSDELHDDCMYCGALYCKACFKWCDSCDTLLCPDCWIKDENDRVVDFTLWEKEQIRRLKYTEYCTRCKTNAA